MSMFVPIKRTPQVVYHFTKKENAEKIIQDRKLKKFKDSHVFVCEELEYCKYVYQNTILNPDAKFIDFDGFVKSYSTKNTGDYVILKLEPRFSEPMNWFASNSSKTKQIDNKSLAYKGNLSVNVIEIIEI